MWWDASSVHLPFPFIFLLLAPLHGATPSGKPSPPSLWSALPPLCAHDWCFAHHTEVVFCVSNSPALFSPPRQGTDTGNARTGSVSTHVDRQGSTPGYSFSVTSLWSLLCLLSDQQTTWVAVSLARRAVIFISVSHIPCEDEYLVVKLRAIFLIFFFFVCVWIICSCLCPLFYNVFDLSPFIFKSSSYVGDISPLIFSVCHLSSFCLIFPFS